MSRSSAFLLLALVSCGSSSSSPAVSQSGSDAEAPDSGGAETAAPADPGDPPLCSGMPGTGGSPTLRGDHGGALDVTGSKLMVFGGDSAVPGCMTATPDLFLADTWILDVGCGSWQQIMPAASPPARARQVTVGDPTNNRAIVFGGRGGSASSGYVDFSDVWAFDFAAETWSQIVTTGTAPSGRSNSAGVLDGNRLIVFGGDTGTSDDTLVPVADSFALDLGTGVWSAFATGGSAPEARLFHVMAADSTTHTAWMFGGAGANAFVGEFYDDVWSLDLGEGTWTKVETSGTDPGARIKPSLAFDANASALVLFGGHDLGIGNQNDVHLLDVTSAPAAWTKLAGGDTSGGSPAMSCTLPASYTTIDPMSPERRSGFAIGARPDGRGFVVHGGDTDCGLADDAWWWNDDSHAWMAVAQSPIGLSCPRVMSAGGCTSLCE